MSDPTELEETIRYKDEQIEALEREADKWSRRYMEVFERSEQRVKEIARLTEQVERIKSLWLASVPEACREILIKGIDEALQAVGDEEE